jgi:hypothetical protein
MLLGALFRLTVARVSLIPTISRVALLAVAAIALVSALASITPGFSAAIAVPVVAWFVAPGFFRLLLLTKLGDAQFDVVWFEAGCRSTGRGRSRFLALRIRVGLRRGGEEPFFVLVLRGPGFRGVVRTVIEVFLGRGDVFGIVGRCGFEIGIGRRSAGSLVACGCVAAVGPTAATATATTRATTSGGW